MLFPVVLRLKIVRKGRKVIHRELLYPVDDVGGNFRKQTYGGSIEKSSLAVDIMLRFPCGAAENEILDNSRSQNKFIEYIPYYVAPSRDTVLPTLASNSHRVMSLQIQNFPQK